MKLQKRQFKNPETFHEFENAKVEIVEFSDGHTGPVEI